MSGKSFAPRNEVHNATLVRRIETLEFLHTKRREEGENERAKTRVVVLETEKSDGKTQVERIVSCEMR